MERRRDYESGPQPEAQAHLGLALAVAAGDAAIIRPGHLRRSGRRGWSCSQFQMERRGGLRVRAPASNAIKPWVLGPFACTWAWRRSRRRGDIDRSDGRGWSCSQFQMERRGDYKSESHPESEGEVDEAVYRRRVVGSEGSSAYANVHVHLRRECWVAFNLILATRDLLETIP